MTTIVTGERRESEPLSPLGYVTLAETSLSGM